MTDTFYHGETGQALRILGYDETKINNNVRYKAVINDDQLAVLHLQSVDTKDTSDVSELSLCPGVLESEVLHLLSQSPVSNTLVCVMFLIEKLQTDIVYRSRSCHLLFDPRQWEGRCFSCRDLLRDLALNADGEKPEADLGLTDLMLHNEPDLQDNRSDNFPDIL